MGIIVAEKTGEGGGGGGQRAAATATWGKLKSLSSTGFQRYLLERPENL